MHEATGSSFANGSQSTTETRPSKANLMEAKVTAMRRNHTLQTSDHSSMSSKSAWGQSQSDSELCCSQQHSIRSCSFETTFINKGRRFPMYNGERRINQHPETRPACILSTEDDERITRDVLALYNELLPTSEEIQKKYDLVAKLERLLNAEWPGKNFTVHAFGSTENMLATHKSDLDVCIETEWTGFGHQVCQLSSFMARCGMQDVVCRAKAKVPVVAIYDPELGVSCDMNINNKLALRNTKLVKTYMQIDERARQLTYAVKHWAAARALNDAVCNTLTSYTWTLMVISFLQNRKGAPILPSLQQWPHEPMPPISGIDVSFADDLEKYDLLKTFSLRNTESVGSLLLGFFYYYAYEFNYERDVASIRVGHVLSRRDKAYPSDNMFCIEEPFTTSRNLGNTADMGSHRGIHQELQRAYKLLANKEELSIVFAEYTPSEHPVSAIPDRPQRRQLNNKPRQYRGHNNYRQYHFNNQHHNQGVGGFMHQGRQRKQDCSAYPSSGIYTTSSINADDVHTWKAPGANDHWFGPEYHVDFVQTTHWQYLSEEDNHNHAMSQLLGSVAMDYYCNPMPNPYYMEKAVRPQKVQVRVQNQHADNPRGRMPKRETKRNHFPKAHAQQSADSHESTAKKQHYRPSDVKARNRFFPLNEEHTRSNQPQFPGDQHMQFTVQCLNRGDLARHPASIVTYCSSNCPDISHSDAGDSQISTFEPMSSTYSSPRSSASELPSACSANVPRDSKQSSTAGNIETSAATETFSSHFAQARAAQAKTQVSSTDKGNINAKTCAPPKPTYASKLLASTTCSPTLNRSTKVK